MSFDNVSEQKIKSDMAVTQRLCKQMSFICVIAGIMKHYIGLCPS